MPDLAARYRYALDYLLGGTGIAPDSDHVLVRGLHDASAAAAQAFGDPRRVARADLRPHGDEQAPVPFWYADGTPDLVGSAFWWLAGLDELRAGARDDHGRVVSADSLLVQAGWAERPIVDAYRRTLIGRLRGAGLDARSPGGWALCPTHDLDALRKWRPGILWREIGQRAVRNRLGEQSARRLRRAGRAVHGLLAPGDPYAEAPLRLAAASERLGGRATLFFKAASRSSYDVGYRVPTATLETLRAAGHEIGLHPSYASYDAADALRREAERLGLPRRFAHRAHYLRYDVLRSPGILDRAGAAVDSTLGWSDRAGFRRGAARPFPLYDLLAERPSDVVEIPLVLMDGAVFDRMGLDGESARVLTRRLIGEIARSGGAAAMLWHHHTYDADDAPGWADHFERTLDDAARLGGQLLPVGEAAGRVVSEVQR